MKQVISVSLQSYSVLTRNALQSVYNRLPGTLSKPLSRLSRLACRMDNLINRPFVKPLTLAFVATSLLLTLIAYITTPWFELVVNRSDSLPGTLYFLDKTTAPTCGDATVFDMPVDSRFYRGSRMIKLTLGCPGDTISLVGQTIYLNNIEVAEAMERTTNQQYELYAIDAGVIPDKHFYLAASHPRSYDSRYRSFGLRHADKLLGTAHRIF